MHKALGSIPQDNIWVACGCNLRAGTQKQEDEELEASLDYILS